MSKRLEIQALTYIIKAGEWIDELSPSDFVGCRDEAEFIYQHHIEYGKMPGMEVMLERFDTWELIDCEEPPSYYVQALYEYWTLEKADAAVRQYLSISGRDPRAALAVLRPQLSSIYERYAVSNSDMLLADGLEDKVSKDIREHKHDLIIPTGLAGYDGEYGGLYKQAELVTVMARPGIGKTWLLMFIAANMVRDGRRIGFVNTELSNDVVVMRFSTALRNDSFAGVSRGDIAMRMKNKESWGDVAITHRSKFRGGMTADALESFCKTNSVDALFVDGLQYMTSSRAVGATKRFELLEYAAEELMNLSTELRIPVVVSSQANREKDGDSLTMTNMRGGDGANIYSSVVIAIAKKSIQHKLYIETQIIKSRNSVSDVKHGYEWLPDTCEYLYDPGYGDQEPETQTPSSVLDSGDATANKGDVFI